MKYQNIMGKGHIELIMKNVADKEVVFNDQKVSNVAIMKLIIDTLTCILL